MALQFYALSIQAMVAIPTALSDMARCIPKESGVLLDCG